MVFVEIAEEKEQVAREKAQERSEKVLRMNQVCSMAISTNEMADHSSSLLSRNSNMPRIIIQNDAYHPPSLPPAYLQ